MTHPRSYSIGLELSRSQYCTAVALGDEPIWIRPGSGLRHAVPRVDLSRRSGPYTYWEACEDGEEHGGPLMIHRPTSGTSSASGRS